MNFQKTCTLCFKYEIHDFSINSPGMPLLGIKNGFDPTAVIILRVPSIKIPVFFAHHTPEKDRHRILRLNHPFILDLTALKIKVIGTCKIHYTNTINRFL